MPRSVHSESPRFQTGEKSSVEGWKCWLEETRYADVGRDRAIDKGYLTLLASVDVLPPLLDVLLSIATDPKALAYQSYTATVLISNVTTEAGIATLDHLLRYIVDLDDTDHQANIRIKPVIMAIEQ